jgi:hypothetical protein
MLKWMVLPYPLAAKGLRNEVMEPLRREKVLAGELKVLPIASLLLPAVEKVYFSQARIDRKIAALRCIEALRLYAAAHGGALPDRLDQITEVPIPDDPVVGRPFEYSHSGNSIRLTTLPPAGEEANAGNVLRYELSFRPANAGR